MIYTVLDQGNIEVIMKVYYPYLRLCARTIRVYKHVE